jgi:hypothetical protein
MVAGGSAFAEPESRRGPETNPGLKVVPIALAETGPDTSACLTVAPDRTDHVINGGVELFNTSPIGHPGCAAFVADFTLDKASVNTGPSGNTVVFDGRDSVRETVTGNHTYYVMHITKEQCSAYKHWIWAYRKRQGETAFSAFGGGGMTPSWDTGGLDGKGLGGPICRLKPNATFSPIANVVPPATGVDTYRVVLAIPNPPGQVLISALRTKP